MKFIEFGGMLLNLYHVIGITRIYIDTYDIEIQTYNSRYYEGFQCENSREERWNELKTLLCGGEFLSKC